jgi:chemotaxis protein CheD
MLTDLRAQGVEPQDCEAKIFGGGNMFPERRGSGVIKVGKNNGLAARAMLDKCKIKVLTESLFGIGHRQIIFDLSRGDVWARQVKPVQAKPQTKTKTKTKTIPKMESKSCALSE